MRAPGLTGMLALALPLAAHHRPVAAQQQPAARVAQAVNADVFAAHLTLLADDALEGRGTGERGGETAAKYLAAQFARLGLEPAGDAGTYYHHIPLVGRRFTSTLRLSADTLVPGEDFVAYLAGTDTMATARGEAVFVGYGIVAPEQRWNDYAGADVRGKIVVALAGTPADQDSALFRDARPEYAFRQYKVDEAARRGAAAALVVYRGGVMPVPWPSIAQSWLGEQVQLDPPARAGSLLIGGWLNEPAARRLVEQGGADFRTLAESAARPGFRAVPLRAALDVGVAARTRRIPAANVVGRLPGRGSLAGEAVVLGAHYDHLGIGAPVAEDSIYNGAVDNASGTAGMLTVAEAMVRGAARPARSVLFVGFGAEEQGLLGSESFVNRPPVPLRQIAAMVNLDALNLTSESRDIAALGAELSSLGSLFRSAAAAEGYRLTPRSSPVLVEAMQQDFFNRSDQAPFARAGVPALFLYAAAHDLVGRPAGAGKAELDRYLERHYHQPSDDLRQGLDPRVAVRQLRVVTRTLLAAANQRSQAVWSANAPYRSAGERRVSRDQ
ncbi:MAG TPA: M28 family peptidase [Gemmatimonadales bacterium]|nr:M28 family peptidase [Gemmatimonadales bacterium]